MTVRFKNPDVERLARANKRLRVFYVGLSIGYLIVVGRAISLMLKDNNQLEEIAMTQYRAAIQKETNRSRILDSKGHELAISIPAWSLYADPREVLNPESVTQVLAKILKADRNKLLEKLQEKRKFVWLDRRLDVETMKKIRRFQFKGIYNLKENMRFYPHGELASNILGTVGIDSQPLAGIEMSYDPYLMIVPKAAVYLKDAKGRLYRTPQPLEQARGKGDVYLTIDKNLQYFAEQSLRKAVAKHKAKAGVLIMMNPKTGDIKAMANFPSFNPNEFQKTDWSSWRNRAVTDIYEPGSTFKIVVASAALESGLVDLEETFDCERGRFQLPGSRQVIHDDKPHDQLNIQEIIKYSSNIGAYKIARRIGKERFYEKIAAFGFGKKMGIDFPGEAAGIIKPSKEWTPIEEGTISFGHGVGATPLQLASAFSAIANNGIQMQPHFVEKVIGPEGEIQYQSEHREMGRPILPKTAGLLKEMLKGVVAKGGTATKAQIPEYLVAGKSGTARKVDPNERGYLKGKYIASFVGFAPEEDPHLVTLVLLDEPQGTYYGGKIAAPVFKEVTRRALHYLGLPPRGKSKLVRVAKEAPKELRIIKGVTKVTREGDRFKLPDFRGASMREVLQAMGDYPIEARFKGWGEAKLQRPRPGALVSAGSKIYVEFKPLY